MNAEPLEVAPAAHRPLEVEQLVPAHARRVTIEQHAAFRESIATPEPADEIDELVAELRQLKPEAGI